MTNFIVTNLNDSGTGSLRQAILDANTAPSADTIDFDTLLSGGTITLTSGELLIADDLTINGLGAENLTVSGNNASRVFNVDDGDFENNIDVVIDGLTIADGFAEGDFFSARQGGGIFSLENLTVTNSTISGNTAEEEGGGIFGRVTVTDSTISGNTAFRGDGIAGSRIEVTNSTISGNTGGGGGIYTFGGYVQVTDSTISGNTGPGIFSRYGYGYINKVTNSTISGNSGGGIRLLGSDMQVTGSTISGNTAGSGGGIAVIGGDYGGGSLEVNNSTISGNTAAEGGGIYNRYFYVDGYIIPIGEATVANSIIAGNTDDKDIGGQAPFTSSGFNLIGNGDGASGFTDGVNGDLVGTSANPIDPKLGPLQDNGGPTETQALLPGSPAIDAADPNFTPPPEFDQRGPGFPRVLDGDDDGIAILDIGAFETDFQLFDTLTVDTLVDEDDGDLSSGDVSLREAIRFIKPEGTIDFDPSLASADVGFGQGTIGLELGQLVIDKSLTINGLGADELTVSGNNTSRVFNLDDGDSGNQIEVVIEGLTITGGNAADFGGGISNRESLELSNSTISGNSAGDEGGGIANAFDDIDSTLKVIDSTISDNSAGGDGGGITNRGTLIVKNSTISGNTSNDQGGGIYSQSTVEVKNSTISGNSAGDEGGGIANAFDDIDSTLKIIDSTISDNSAGGDGGGITNRGTLIVKKSTISGNTSNDQGGGIYSQSTVEVKNSTISGNSASESGGGIDNSRDGTVEVINSTISGNSANNVGGGVSNSGQLELSNTPIVSDSFVSFDSAAIYCNETVIKVSNTSTIVSSYVALDDSAC